MIKVLIVGLLYIGCGLTRKFSKIELDKQFNDNFPTSTSTSSPPTDPTEECSCVPFYQCSPENTHNTNGEFLIDIRFNPGSEEVETGTCTHYLDMWCCKPKNADDSLNPGSHHPDSSSQLSGSGSQHLGSGYQHPDDGFQHPGSSSQPPDSNYQNPSSGSHHPDSGSQHPGSGSQYPGSGSQHPYGGFEHPNSGSQPPDSNPQHPGSGSQNPGSGSHHPDSGSQYPESGSQPPDSTPQHPGSGSQHPGSGSQYPGSGSPHPDGGTQHPDSSSQHSESGSQQPGGGYQHPDSGSQHPDVGSQHLNSGSQHNNGGYQHSDGGSQHPNSGSQPPDSNPQHPDSGSQHPGSGSPHPHGGSQHPDSGSQQPDVGSQHLNSGSQHPNGGSQQPESGPQHNGPKPPHGGSQHLDIGSHCPNVEPEPLACGVRNPDGAGFRITGAEDNEANYCEFPWMVALLARNPRTSATRLECGASLIHPQVVLTAAHCVKGKRNLFIRAGDWDSQTDKEMYPTQDRTIKKVVIHEEFYSGTVTNNIALLVLDSPLDMSLPNVGLLCLPEQGEVMDHRECISSGWGKDVFGKAGKYQVIMKRTELDMVTRSECQERLRKSRLGHTFQLHESFICAIGHEGMDTCKGDGGGALACPSKSNPDVYVQAGIVAWGIGCGSQFPAAYVNVPLFRTWIDDQLDTFNRTHLLYKHMRSCAN